MSPPLFPLLTLLSTLHFPTSPPLLLPNFSSLLLAYFLFTSHRSPPIIFVTSHTFLIPYFPYFPCLHFFSRHFLTPPSSSVSPSSSILISFHVHYFPSSLYPSLPPLNFQSRPHPNLHSLPLLQISLFSYVSSLTSSSKVPLTSPSKFPLTSPTSLTLVSKTSPLISFQFPYFSSSNILSPPILPLSSSPLTLPTFRPLISSYFPYSANLNFQSLTYISTLIFPHFPYFESSYFPTSLPFCPSLPLHCVTSPTSPPQIFPHFPYFPHLRF